MVAFIVLAFSACFAFSDGIRVCPTDLPDAESWLETDEWRVQVQTDLQEPHHVPGATATTRKSFGKVQVAIAYMDWHAYDVWMRHYRDRVLAMEGRSTGAADAKAAAVLEGLSERHRKTHELSILSTVGVGKKLNHLLMLKTGDGLAEKYRASLIQQRYEFYDATAQEFHFHFEVFENLANIKAGWRRKRSNQAGKGRSAMYFITCSVEQAAQITEWLSKEASPESDQEIDGDDMKPSKKNTMPEITLEQCRKHVIEMISLGKEWEEFTTTLMKGSDNVKMFKGTATQVEVKFLDRTVTVLRGKLTPAPQLVGRRVQQVVKSKSMEREESEPNLEIGAPELIGDVQALPDDVVKPSKLDVRTTTPEKRVMPAVADAPWEGFIFRYTDKHGTRLVPCTPETYKAL